MPPVIRSAKMHSVRQVAEQLCLCTKTIRRLMKRGDLRYHRIGRSVRISEEDLRNYTNAVRR